jgi:hypothetical protein
MFKVFKITSASTKPKTKPRGDKLVGLLIVQTDEHWYVVSTGSKHEDPPTILAKSGLLLSEKRPLLTFNFHFEEKGVWGLSVDHLNDSDTDPHMSGRWVNPTDPDQEDDTWVATGSGKGGGADDEEAQGASASY